nr:ribonuclease H-like domain-containing protein [Tanacetum cinerariifolium]
MALWIHGTILDRPTVTSYGVIRRQSRRDLPKDTPIDKLEVLRYDFGKRSKARMGIMPTETELTLEQTQQELNETYDKVDGSVVYNLLQEINIVKQGGSSVADYYQRINSLWREFDALTKLPKCTCDVKYSCDACKELGLHQQLMKLMQLLMGLDDCYQPVKISLLTKDPLPEVKDAYNVVL